MTLGDQIIELIEETLGFDIDSNVSANEDLYSDLAFDELDIMELIMRLEEVFLIEVTDNEAFNWKTVQDVIDFVKKSKEE